MSGATAPPAAAESRVQAPFGRRRAAVTAARDVGAYRLLACADHSWLVSEGSEGDNGRAVTFTVRVKR